MSRSGVMIVLPSLLKQCSTARGFELVTRLAIHPAGSRLRTVPVSIRRETLPSAPAQLAVSRRPLLKRKQDLGGPSSDEDRGRHFRSCIVFLCVLRDSGSRSNQVMAAHEIDLEPDI